VRVLIVSARTRSNIDGIITSIEGGVVSMNDKEIAKLRAEREQRMRAPAKYLSAGASTPTHIRWRNSMFDQPRSNDHHQPEAPVASARPATDGVPQIIVPKAYGASASPKPSSSTESFRETQISC
jgi:hypothetical protein